ERLQAFADRLGDLASALLCCRFVEAGIADEGAVRALDHPDVIGDRRHLVMGIAEDVVLGPLARMRPVADGINLVDVVAHDFLPPTVTPARFSIILTIEVKSLSPPYSVFVVSHCARVASIIACGVPTLFASSKQSRTSLSISAVAKP